MAFSHGDRVTLTAHGRDEWGHLHTAINHGTVAVVGLKFIGVLWDAWQGRRTGVETLMTPNEIKLIAEEI